MAIRYDQKTKDAVVEFIKKFNKEHGKGGQAAAARKWKLNPITVASWMKKAGKSGKPVKRDSKASPKVESQSAAKESSGIMNYKGYHGVVSFDEEAELFHGEVQGVRGVVTFQGRSVDELKVAFQDSIDDYLDFCAERGEEPDKAYSGKFVLRVDPDLHRRLATKSSQEGTSLNSWVVSKLEKLAES